MTLPAFLKLDLAADLSALDRRAAARVLRAYLRALRSAPVQPITQWVPAAAAAVSLSEPQFRLALADLGILDPDPLRLHGRLRRGRILELRHPFRGLPVGARHLVLGRVVRYARPRYEVLGPDGRIALWSAERVNVSAVLTRAFVVLPPGRLSAETRDAVVRVLWP
jgi:hypothetical protein